MHRQQKMFLAILILLSVSFFGYAMLTGCGEDEEKDQVDSSVTKITEDNFTLTTEYKEESRWEYTVVGQLPNPCYTATTDAIVAESYPEQVSITVSVQVPDADTMCAQVIQEYEYSGEFQASEEATVKLLVE